jgi:hypothetical protein
MIQLKAYHILNINIGDAMKTSIQVRVCNPAHFERLILGEKGRFMGIVSMTKKGLRFFHCRTGVHHGKTLKANPMEDLRFPYVIVWDLANKGYRTVNLKNILTIRCSKTLYLEPDLAEWLDVLPPELNNV